MADSNVFLLQIVTPEQVLLAGEATEIVLRTGEGDATFLAGYAPLVGSVRAGQVRVVPAEGDPETFVTDGGFAQVEYNVPLDDAGAVGHRITVLLGQAQPVGEIDPVAVQAELDAAEAAVAAAGPVDEETGPTTEQLQAQSALTWAQVRLEALQTTQA